MIKRRILATTVLGGLFATGLIWSAAGTVPSAALDVPETVYRPIQSISHSFGSKMAIGYFTTDDGHCNVTLMVAETADPESATQPSAARLRLSLQPGQQVGLDSVEGQTLQVICGSDGERLAVLKGDTAVFGSPTD